MSENRPCQIEREFSHKIATNWGAKPWGVVKRSHKWEKVELRRKERRRAKANPECSVQYRKYHGWEY